MDTLSAFAFLFDQKSALKQESYVGKATDIQYGGRVYIPTCNQFYKKYMYVHVDVMYRTIM